MRKEATIGLAVILILLITFGVVLARRLTGSTDTPAASLAKQQEDKDPSKAGDSPAGKHGATKGSAARPSAAPFSRGPEGRGEAKMPALKPVSSQTHEASPSPVAQWSVASDRGAQGQTSAPGGAEAVPPSMMPFPSVGQDDARPNGRPLPAWTEPQDAYAGAILQTTPRAEEGGRPSPSEPSQQGPPYDPVHPPAAQIATANTPQDGPPPEGLPPLEPAGQSSLASSSTTDGSEPDAGSAAGASMVDHTSPGGGLSPYGYPNGSQSAQWSEAPRGGSGVGGPDGANGFRSSAGQYDGQYEVQPNDNYWVISRKLYGCGAYFKALAEHNRSKVPREDRLAVGELISAPGVPDLERMYPDLCPKPSRRETLRRRALAVSTRVPYGGGRTYVVEEGDTLFDIARYELGKATRWVEIHRLNRDLLGDDADYLTPGMQLVLPEDEPTGRLTRRPGRP